MFYPFSSAWKIVYRRLIGQRAAIIAIRKNGIDFQVIEDAKPVLGNKIRVLFGDGQLARHNYYESGVDLYKFSMDFADAFEHNQANLEFFMKPQPWDRIKPSIPKNAQRNDIEDIRNAITSGMGGPAYLSDGVWI